MKAFAPYVDDLEALLAKIMTEETSRGNVRALGAALDGQPAERLRQLVPVAELRTAGAFFTGSALARRALRSPMDRIGPESVILDPACGAGDLLIACTRHLPIASSLAMTVSRWGDRIVGRDVHPEFVRAAKARLVLEAIRRGASVGGTSLPTFDVLFPHIKCQCGLTDEESLARASHIILNPPYTLAEAPPECDWGSGIVNSAAIFLEACLRHAQGGTKIIAILPEVLRSGVRYAKWRNLVESQACIRRVRIVGRFARWADVDVFTLEADVSRTARTKRPANWQYPREKADERLSDHFEISVGPVVSYREPHRGPWHLFVCARDLPSWTTVPNVKKHRRYSGRTVAPPLVVVRRTSRPGDQHRAVGTILTGLESVAVENHLLVLRPKNGKLARCRSLLKLLRRPEVTVWLNKRIRCRHLTVAALRELPWRSNSG